MEVSFRVQPDNFIAIKALEFNLQNIGSTRNQDIYN